MNRRALVQRHWSRGGLTIATRALLGVPVAVSALLVACGGQPSPQPKHGASTTRSHTARVAPTSTPLPTFGPGDVAFNVSDDFGVPIPASWDNRTGDTDFASANGIPSDTKTELLIEGPGGGNGVTVPVLFVIQEPGDAIVAGDFRESLMQNSGGFGNYLIRSTGELSIDGAYAYQVTVTATDPDDRPFAEWNVLVNHVGNDGKQHTYAIGFISSPDAFGSLLPTAQNVIGGLVWFP